MTGDSSAAAARADRWGWTAWVVTAGLWLSSVVVTGDDPLVDALPGMDLGNPAVLLAMGGVTMTFVCLLEMYPRIAGRAPYLAQGGLAASGLSAAVNPILYGVVMLSLRRPDIWELPGAAAFGQLVGFLWMAGMVIYPLGTTLYGVAMLRIGRRPDSLGYLLFAPLVVWALFGLTLLTTVSGDQVIGSLIVPVLLAGSFLAIGTLRLRQ